MPRTIGASGIAAVLLSVLSLASPAARAVTFGDVGPYFDFGGDNGGLPPSIPQSIGQQQLDQGIKLYGSAGPMDGATVAASQHDLVLSWQGDFAGAIQAGDKLVADMNFNVAVTGGSTTWKLYADIWSNEGFEDARILTDPVAIDPSGQVQNAHLESTAFTQPGETGLFEGYLDIGWSGYAPTDTLTLTIPQQSLDFTYAAVPEPGAVGLMLVALATVGVRRKGRAIDR